MKKLLLLLVLCGVGLITYLLHRENPIAEKIKALYGMKVSLPVEEMLLVSSKGKECIFKETKYKMVVFYDSTFCSSCIYNNLYIWNDFIEEANKGKDRVQFYFIMNPSQKNKKDLLNTIQTNDRYMDFLLVDTIGSFINTNKFLPIERLYHCMLLDSTNQIMLVGNPISNNQLKKLYLNTILN